MKKQCIIEGCAGEYKAKGLCRKHYKRLVRGGDPHTPSQKEMSLEERLQAGLGAKDPVTGCIEWTGYKRKKMGYGQINRGGRMVGTHCLAYELKHGPIPEGMCVCHHCDNPSCCNDAHLYLGTKADNNADRESKGRGKQPKGAKNGRSKLTEADVLEIRRLLAAGETLSTLAANFGVDRSTISKIRRGDTWKHNKILNA
jgi:hypothetical protein